MIDYVPPRAVIKNGANALYNLNLIIKAQRELLAQILGDLGNQLPQGDGLYAFLPAATLCKLGR